MYKAILLFYLSVMVAACASFDRTNILPGQEVQGLGFSFEVPTDNNWTTVEYGTTNKMHLFQLNDRDNYSIIVSLNQGPHFGMYKSAEAHLRAFKRTKDLEPSIEGLAIRSHQEWVEPAYGKLCVRYFSKEEDWRGRNQEGPALVDLIGLSCHHPKFDNVIITTEIIRRYEVDAPIIDLSIYADALFSSFEYHSL